MTAQSAELARAVMMLNNAIACRDWSLVTEGTAIVENLMGKPSRPRAIRLPKEIRHMQRVT